MVEPFLEKGGEGVFTGMPAGTVPTVVAERHRLDQGNVEAECLSDRSRHLGDFEGMGHAVALMVTGKHEHLCLAGEATERRVVENSVAVTFEAGSVRVGSLLDAPITTADTDGRVLGEQHLIALLASVTGHDLGTTDRRGGVGVSHDDLVVAVTGHGRGPAFGAVCRVVEKRKVVHAIEDTTELSERPRYAGGVSQFVDECQLNVKGGDGGAGCVSMRREGPVSMGGPNGGDGGNGGDIWLVADHNVASLLAFRDHPHRKAERGIHGKGKDQHGARGESLEIKVPIGTKASDLYTGEVFAELNNQGDRWLAAAGGRGGRGNAKFLSNKRRAPAFAEQGEHGEDRWLKLELRLMADVALVGFPNVGKSTLISVISEAKPKIANYPFTTLEPNLGVVRVDDDTEFVVADIPGLIEGASEGRGLGHQFLRHVERARVLCLMIDLAPVDGVWPNEQEEILLRELGNYQPDLLERPRIVVGTKADMVQEGDLEIMEWEGDVVSSITGDGVGALVGRMAAHVHDAREEIQYEDGLIVIRPEASGAVVERIDDGEFRLVGRDVERVVALNDVTTPEALAYIDYRLERLGVPKMLARAGAAEGDIIWIGDFSFDYSPDR